MAAQVEAERERRQDGDDRRDASRHCEPHGIRQQLHVANRSARGRAELRPAQTRRNRRSVMPEPSAETAVAARQQQRSRAA